MIVMMRCDEMRAFVWKDTEAHARDLTPLRCDAMRCDLTLAMRGSDEMGLIG
jgi:hypothetical protein